MPENVIEKCLTCNNGIWCDTWAEWKCTKKQKRVYDQNERVDCTDYDKRSRGAVAAQCQCEDCLKRGVGKEKT